MEFVETPPKDPSGAFPPRPMSQRGPLALSLLCALASACGEDDATELGDVSYRVAPIVVQIDSWGTPAEAADVRDIVLDVSDVIVGGTEAGSGFVCKYLPAVGGCSLAITDSDVVVATRGGAVKKSFGWALDVDGSDLILAGKSNAGSTPAACGPKGADTNAWLQKRGLADLSIPTACSNPNLAGNDEGLAVKVANGRVFWGGTRKRTGSANQVAVLHMQSLALNTPPAVSFPFDGGALAELFGITHGNGVVYVTGRTDSDYTATPACIALGAACMGSQGPLTDTFVAAFDDTTLALLWMWQDASPHKSAGQAIEYYDDGLNEGLILTGHYNEPAVCLGYDDPTPGGNQWYTDGFVTWMPMNGAGFFTGGETQALHGDPCVGDTFMDIAVDGTTIYAVGAELGPKAACGPSNGHCPPNGLEDGALATYTLDPALGSLTLDNNLGFSGVVGDSTDAVMTIEHDPNLGLLYLGGVTQSAVFGSAALTGVQDAFVITLSQ